MNAVTMVLGPWCVALTFAGGAMAAVAYHDARAGDRTAMKWALVAAVFWGGGGAALLAEMAGLAAVVGFGLSAAAAGVVVGLVCRVRPPADETRFPVSAIWDAYATGARDARAHGGRVSDDLILRSADAYCKLVCRGRPAGSDAP